MVKTFKELALLCERLETTSSRNEKISLVVQYLRSFAPHEFDEAGPAAFLLVGMSSGIRRIGTNVGPSTLYKAVSEKQSLLLNGQPLTISDVWSTLRKIMKAAGSRSTDIRKTLLSNLFARADELEKKWIKRIIAGEMRHGFNAGLLLEALSEYSRQPIETIQTADMLLGNIGELAKKTLQNKLNDVKLTVFRPIKPMLAQYVYTVDEISDELGIPVFIEPKIDGVRIQTHVKEGEVKVFSRGLKDLTQSVPDIVETVKTSVKCSTAIVDGEAYCVDEKGRQTPFQETMRRIGREKNVEEALKVLKLEIKFFDIIHLDGKDLWFKPLRERRQFLESIVEPTLLNPLVIAENTGAIQRKLDEWVDGGFEGLMAKSPKSPYTPGRRGGFWVKLKPAQTLDVVVVAAEWGHGRRRGWLSNYHLAVLDERSGKFVPVGKTFKGLTDDEFRKMTELLLGIKTKETEWGVLVQPKIVLEIEYNEVQRSPHYPSGYALRFARVKSIRLDKSPSEIDTLAAVEEAFRHRRKVFTT